MRWLLAIGELVLLCCFVAVGIEAIVQRVAGMASPFNLREFHHAYLGALLVALGWALHSVSGIFVQQLGMILTIDDLYQHTRQTLYGAVRYQSPLHTLFARYLWRYQIVQRITRALDQWWLVGAVFALLALWIFT